MKHKILIVGGGSIGERHVRCFQAAGRAEVSLCELSEERGGEIARLYGVALQREFSSALGERPDGVVICTPTPIHVAMAREALSAGCHVLIEKPLSTQMEGTEELAHQARQTGKAVGVAYVWRMHPALRKARDILQSGEMGACLHVTAIGGQDFAALRPGYADTLYAHGEAGGGAIQDALTHVANSVQMLVGPATSVLCDARHLAIPGVEVEDFAGVVARHGRIAVVYPINQIQKPNEFQFDVNCEGGSLRVDFFGKRLGLFREGAWQYEATPYADHDVLFTAQARAFLDEIEGRGTMGCSLDEGIATLRFNLACLQSAGAGGRVDL